MNANVGVRTHDFSRARDLPYEAPWHVESKDHCFFYHTLDLGPHGVQEGPWDLRGQFDAYIGYVDVEGKRVLDVGTASGFLSFEAERQGAREVVSFDLDTAERQDLLPFVGSKYVDDHDRWCVEQTNDFATWKRAYWYAHRLLDSEVKVVYGDVYNPPVAMGLFDVIIVGAILEHLVDPLSALRALARHADPFMKIIVTYGYLTVIGHRNMIT